MPFAFLAVTGSTQDAAPAAAPYRVSRKVGRVTATLNFPLRANLGVTRLIGSVIRLGGVDVNTGTLIAQPYGPACDDVLLCDSDFTCSDDTFRDVATGGIFTTTITVNVTDALLAGLADGNHAFNFYPQERTRGFF